MQQSGARRSTAAVRSTHKSARRESQLLVSDLILKLVRIDELALAGRRRQ
jgi:hypothetical protein